ncbi:MULTISPECIES: Fur-regulated basic protein FbpA [Bacillaceae]|nr:MULTISPECIES: Fur-regulated basic protein FbpA [Bacillus]MCA1034898.1 Fur-regulated basic protein FbpA [Bacillus infantis]MCP1158580.1 Fur-regulated basic protein FbpA [Bacillus infantis]MDT0163205.1 Fur-regulated basic protein FbpA [Bacillus sp. AG4(2022)]MDW2878870.1 Fur-regulated basic protein FbpA [Bacillus infantis]PLR75135.1 Fur-regulated basic protein FbpA [Bacillus sp. UMB0728]
MKEETIMIKEEEKKDQLISELLSMGIYKQEGRQLFQVPYEELLKLYQENRSHINE